MTEYPLVELGGDGPVAHLALANGFPPPCYLPFLEVAVPGHRRVCLPPRALWPGIGSPPREPGSWISLADDLLRGLDRHFSEPVVGIGHSFGGVATLLAATREPERFRALVLLDPTMLPPEVMRAIAEAREVGGDPRPGLARGAERRRSRFGSREEAFNYWRDKPLFQDWGDRVLRLYVEGMLKPATDGEGFELAWSGAWEAWYYRSFYPGTWDHLARLSPTLPVLVVRGERSDTFLAAAEAHFGTVRPDATLRVVSGAGHLFPQSSPEPAGQVVHSWLRVLEGRSIA